ncbi:MAG: hypothetical protein MRY21_07330 [Simkaniaceae bacterium]|nr:hypothetical protein [Simkaniaceae bacterium]
MIHPLVVHFPIALTCVALILAIISIFVRSRGFHSAFFLVVIFAMIGAMVAVETGESALAAAKTTLTTQELDLTVEHSEWGRSTRFVLWICAGLAIIQIIFAQLKLVKPTRLIALLTTLALIVATFFIYETGKRGGNLVFEHGIGVKQRVEVMPQQETENQKSPSSNR